MDNHRSSIIGTVLVTGFVVAFAALGHAATGDTTDSGTTTSVTKATVESSVQAGPSGVLARAIAAGQAAMKRSLATQGKAEETAGPQTSSKTTAQKTAAGTKASKTLSSIGTDATSGKAKKYVFEYPNRPVIAEEMLPVKKTIEGEVGSVIKMGMSVTFERDAATASSRDLWIDFTKGTKLEGVKSFGAFREGDIVKVSYTESKDGAKRAIDSIRLVKTLTDEERKAIALADEAATRAEEELAKKEEAMQEKP